MKSKKYPHFPRLKEETVRIKLVSPLSPAYCGNVAHLIRLYLRICSSPYLHLPRVRANRTPWHFIEQDAHFLLGFRTGFTRRPKRMGFYASNLDRRAHV